MQNRNNSWMAGLVLIILGVVFLFQNITGVDFGNWWAIFILMPALWAFWSAWGIYQKDGRITRRVANMVYGGMFPFLVAVIFLFNLSWGRLWPLFLLLAGVGAIFGWGKEAEKPLSDQDKFERGQPG